MAEHSRDLAHAAKAPTVRADQRADAVADLSDDDRYEQAIGVLADLTDRLLDTAKGLDDEDVREPSLLPGWTRGHVLTHVARNADGLCNVLRGASTGVPTPAYASREARAADIEAGSGRSASELEADVDASGERLLAAIAALPGDRRHVAVRTGSSGIEAPAHDVLWWRIREVGYHHVDLGAGYTFADLPVPVLVRGLDEALDRLRQNGGPPLWLEPTDQVGWSTRGEGRGAAPDAEPVRGSLADLLAWLTGRSDGAGLQSSRPLPALPAWG